MSIKLFKKINIFVIILSFSFILILSNVKKLNAASSANIRYITTSVGENATSVGINYHTDVNNSYVVYGKSQNLSSGTHRVNATSTAWSQETLATDEKTGFNERYVCQVNLKDLEENTQYYYQVVAGGETSPTYSFKTYSDEGTRADFIFATDMHCSPSMPSTAKTINNMFSALLQKNRNINMVLMTGDQIDRGGYESEWQAMYNDVKVFNQLMQATIPGNHEYYHSKDSKYVSPEFYNKFYNNPKNGVEQRLNSSYYFKYGNALIIMLDVINREYLTEQQEWFKQVCENNPAQWIIVGTHAGGVTAGIYDHDASWIQENWVPLWEQYQVDLCLSGHEHIYIRKDLWYEGQKNEDLGLTYLVGCAAGHKSYATQDETGLVIHKTSFACNVISIRNDRMTVTLYDQNGNELNKSFELKTKREINDEIITDDKIYDSIELDYDKENQTGFIRWDKAFFGNVKTVKISKICYGNEQKFDTYISTSKVTYKDIAPLFNNFDYDITVTCEKYDGTTIEKKFNIYNQASYKLTLDAIDGYIDDASNITSYKVGEKTPLPTPIKAGFAFDGWYDNPEFTGNKYTEISEQQLGDLTLYAKYKESQSSAPTGGCQMGSSLLIINLLTVTSLFAFVLRKKK